MVSPTPTTVQVKIQLRGDTAANWASVNPVLLNNELGLETDTKKLKVGNGSTAWNSLAYFPSIVTGGTVLGNLEIGSTGTLTFEGSTANDFETTLAVTDPTADRTITLPDQSGTVVVTGNASIVDADIAANAEIAVSKLANGTANQVIVTDGTNVSWSDDLTLAGNLTVNGTTTTINTQDLLVEDKNIIIGNVDTPSDVTADGGGVTLKGATDKTINWIDATDSWTSSENIDLANGKSYRINGAEVLSATTLGSGVTSSSLTSVGTITSGTWQGSAIGASYLDSTVVTTGDTGTVTSTMIADGTIVNADVSASAAIAHSKLANITAGYALIGNATNVPTATEVTGDVTISDTGVTAISSGVIVNADVSASAAIAGSKVSPDFGSQTITTTGVISAAAGTAAAPSITFTGDLNTGIYSPGADQLALSTNGTGRLFVDASGRVGVGGTPEIGFEVISSSPTIQLRDTNGPTDENRYRISIDGSQNLAFQAINDAGTGGGGYWLFARSGNNIETLTGYRGGTERIKLSNWDNKITFSNALGVLGTATTHDLQILTNNSERLRITSDGKLGLGTSAPATLFHLSSATGSATPTPTEIRVATTTNAADWSTTSAWGRFGFYSGDTSGSGPKNHATIDAISGIVSGEFSNLSFKLDDGSGSLTERLKLGFLGTTTINAAASTAPFIANIGASEAARIDSSARLLLGTSSARANFFNSSLTASFQIEGADHNTSSASLIRNQVFGGTQFGPNLVLGSTGGTSNGSNTLSASPGQYGTISFQGADGNELVEGAFIRAEIAGTPAANSMPGRLVFATTADGSAAATERMNIKSTGAIRYVTAFTVATLPSGEVGDLARVTDASSPTVGATVAGGGAANALCWYNGSNWTVMGV